VEHPGDLSHGDYSSNIAMVLSKKVGENPKALSEKIKTELEKNIPKEIAKVEIAGPGFINFYLSESFFAESIEMILEQKENWGKNNELKGKKVLIEHSSPNLFKPFHIGHVMNNTIGESLTRLARFSHADVTLISYPSDVSLGIGKAVYMLLQKGVGMLDTFSTLQEKLAFLGNCYVEGTRVYDEDPNIEPIVRDITQKIFNKTPGPELDAYEIGKKINLDYFKEITKTLGSNFDDFIYESEAGLAGKKIVQENTPAYIYTK
jgi:arginyl-tRNA synthetase